MRQYVTIKGNDDLINRIKNDYHNYLVNVHGEYEIFRVNAPLFIITGYQSPSKTSIVFEGEDILSLAQQYDPHAKLNEPKKKVITDLLSIENQIGSDEVGTGDFFGPVVVCAVHFKKEDYAIYQQLKIGDSKNFTDEQICELGPTLVKLFTYSLLVCHNDKYNEMIGNGFNMNSLKAWLHNEALYNVINKVGQNNEIYIDQFCQEELYYRYLAANKHVIKNITFQTKGESHYPSIAIASCIARYRFILAMKEMCQKYHLTIPYGASDKVNNFAISFYEKYGLESLNHCVKMNFNNYQTILKHINKQDEPFDLFKNS